MFRNQVAFVVILISSVFFRALPMNEARTTKWYRSRGRHWIHGLGSNTGVGLFIGLHSGFRIGVGGVLKSDWDRWCLLFVLEVCTFVLSSLLVGQIWIHRFASSYSGKKHVLAYWHVLTGPALTSLPKSWHSSTAGHFPVHRIGTTATSSPKHLALLGATDNFGPVLLEGHTCRKLLGRHGACVIKITKQSNLWELAR